MSPTVADIDAALDALKAAEDEEIGALETTAGATLHPPELTSPSLVTIRAVALALTVLKEGYAARVD